MEKTKNRYTLTELLRQNKGSYKVDPFTCELTLVEFDNTRTWYYNSCSHPKCRKKIRPIGNTNKCPTREDQEDNFWAYFTDGPAIAAFTFFSKEENMIIGHTCHTLVTVMCHRQKLITPQLMKAKEQHIYCSFVIAQARTEDYLSLSWTTCSP
ncbi:uncharacterized protein [Rutidosis leptorrhynchoides]|uniref:uncharacterized protein n=1 Tax=Rutidosis leptorrhynchoides TaxID=125765 RepID=UPI003A99E7EE